MLARVQNGNQKSGPGFGAPQPVSLGRSTSPARVENRLARLQSAHGNQGMQRLLSGGVLQRKLTVNQPGDVFEQEADRVADAVMRMPDPGTAIAAEISGGISGSRVQRKCSDCVEELHSSVGLQRMCSVRKEKSHTDPEEDGHIQAKRDSSGTLDLNGALSAEIRALHGRGHALSNSARAFFEPRFGLDLTRVRIHTDSRAAETAHQVDALAFTAGSDIVFGAGQYHPDTSSGRQLIAHELAHVVQQSEGNRTKNSSYSTTSEMTAQGGSSGLDVSQRAALSVQRFGDPRQAPRTMACPIAATAPVDPVVTNILFGLSATALTHTAILELDAVAARWRAGGANRRVRIDGFASTDGPQDVNWTLSCQRAQTVATELESPSSGAPGIPSSFIEVFAQGETSEFATAPEPNRRAEITADIPTPAAGGACANPGVSRTLDLQPVFLRTSPADVSPTGVSWTRRFNEANVIWGKLGVTFNDLGPITLDTPLKTTGSNLTERNAIRALRSGPGVEVFLVDNDVADAGGGGTISGCDASGKVVLSDRGTSDTLLAHELGHTLGLNHPGDPVNPADPGTVMDVSPGATNSTPDPTRNTMVNFSRILCPAPGGTTCLHPDP